MEKMEESNVLELSADLEVFLEKKYGYSWDLSAEISMLVSSIIRYYDYNASYAIQIVEAVKNCKIEKYPNEKKDVTRFKHNNGSYISKPIIKNGLVEGASKTIILPAGYNSNSLSYRKILLNQLLKLIWSFKNEFSQIGNTLIQREGFKKTVYKLEKDDSLKKISEVGAGYESGLVDFVELDIMLKDYILNKKTAEKIYPKESDTYEQSVVILLESVLQMAKSAKEAAMTGNIEEFLKGPECQEFRDKIGFTFEELLNRVDHLQELENTFKNCVDDLSREEALKELKTYASRYLGVEMLTPLLSQKKEKNDEQKVKHSI